MDNVRPHISIMEFILNQKVNLQEAQHHHLPLTAMQNLLGLVLNLSLGQPHLLQDLQKKAQKIC